MWDSPRGVQDDVIRSCSDCTFEHGGGGFSGDDDGGARVSCPLTGCVAAEPADDDADSDTETPTSALDLPGPPGTPQASLVASTTAQVVWSPPAYTGGAILVRECVVHLWLWLVMAGIPDEAWLVRCPT